MNNFSPAGWVLLLCGMFCIWPSAIGVIAYALVRRLAETRPQLTVEKNEVLPDGHRRTTYVLELISRKLHKLIKSDNNTRGGYQ